jgi:hypothetical protein
MAAANRLTADFSHIHADVETADIRICRRDVAPDAFAQFGSCTPFRLGQLEIAVKRAVAEAPKCRAEES